MKKCEKCFGALATRVVEGMEVCDSCAFSLENIQCFKCQLYLPKAELVLWRGNWYCPFCINDIRMEESKAEEHKELKEPELGEGAPHSSPIRVARKRGIRLGKEALANFFAKVFSKIARIFEKKEKE